MDFTFESELILFCKIKKNPYFSTQFCSSANLHNSLVEKLETLCFSEKSWKLYVFQNPSLIILGKSVRIETKQHISDNG